MDSGVGSIRVTGNGPEPSIVLYPNVIAALVTDAARLGGNDPALSPAFRDVTVGRVLGRALAHEIGHYLLRSRSHSPRGLMRMRQPALWLITYDCHPFSLSAEEVA